MFDSANTLSIDYSTDFDLNLRMKIQKANISKVTSASFPRQNMMTMCKRETFASAQ